MGTPTEIQCSWFLPLVMVMIGFAQQSVSEQFVSRVLGGLLLDVVRRLLLNVLLFDVLLLNVPAGADRVRVLGAVHRQQRLVEVAHRVGVLMVFGERGHAPQRFARAAVRIVHHLHRVDGAVRVQRPPLVRYVGLVGKRAGCAVQVEAVVAVDYRLETVVIIVVVGVVIVVVIVVGEREFVVVPLCNDNNNIIDFPVKRYLRETFTTDYEYTHINYIINIR